MFTGRRLSDYSFPSALNAPPARHPRRIINGKDGTDAEVAGYHRAFYAALVPAGFGKIAKAEPVQLDLASAAPQTLPQQELAPQAKAEPPRTLLTTILSLLFSLIGARI
jgi:hypothetical protein